MLEEIIVKLSDDYITAQAILKWERGEQCSFCHGTLHKGHSCYHKKNLKKI